MFNFLFNITRYHAYKMCNCMCLVEFSIYYHSSLCEAGALLARLRQQEVLQWGAVWELMRWLHASPCMIEQVYTLNSTEPRHWATAEDVYHGGTKNAVRQATYAVLCPQDREQETAKHATRTSRDNGRGGRVATESRGKRVSHSMDQQSHLRSSSGGKRMSIRDALARQ